MGAVPGAEWVAGVPAAPGHEEPACGDGPAGVRLRNSAGRIAPRVDIRAGGGYVAAPGSATTNQSAYRVADDTDPV
ncbi:bifunctional DNA primase/polymerase [Amycolatopsis sp. NPDC004368]